MADGGDAQISAGAGTGVGAGLGGNAVVDDGADLAVETEIVPNSSLDDGASFDFTLTAPMWGEFVEAANAYGRGMRRIGLPFLVFFGFFSLLIIGKMGLSIFGDRDMLVTLVVFLFFTAFSLLLFWGKFDSLLVLKVMLRSAEGWFNVLSVSTKEQIRVREQWDGADFDSHWETPCRLLVDGDGVELMVHVHGKDSHVRVGWSDLDCVRLTPRAVVLSPSAGGKAGVDIIPAVADVRFADVDGSVMVDRSVLPDVDGFVDWCRGHIADAAEPQPSSGLRRRLHSFWVWLYGDKEFLDSPPAWSAVWFDDDV